VKGWWVTFPDVMKIKKKRHGARSLGNHERGRLRACVEMENFVGEDKCRRREGIHENLPNENKLWTDPSGYFWFTLIGKKCKRIQPKA